jgi:DNA mismatch repair protein MutS
MTVSPMMAQWHACKKSSPNSLLLFRLGDFYEAFYEDAVSLAKELDLTLTKRQEIPMAGVPFHASEGYIDKLVAKGYRVAIAEQMEDPKAVKGIVKREIVRVITPGTLVNSTLLSDKANNFLTCLTQVNSVYGLCILDVTTADFKVMEFEDLKQVLDELSRLQPKEILLSEKWRADHPEWIAELLEQINPVIHTKEHWHFEHSHACTLLLRHFHVHNLDGFGLKGMIAAINAAGAILQYVQEDLNLPTTHIQTLTSLQLTQYMLIDRSTQRHLELVDSLQEGKKALSLFKLLDQTSTPMGGRLLKQWLLHPLLDPAEIHMRQEAIGDFQANGRTTREISAHLGEIRDLERLIMRIETGYASPRDLVGLRFSLEQIKPLGPLLEVYKTPLIALRQTTLSSSVSVLSLTERIKSALVEAPPLRLSDGNIIQDGYHPEIDRLRALKKDSHSWIASYQTQLRESTQIKTLKVGFTNAFGFYIEVSRGQADKIPDHFQRRQTLVNAERFITPELKEYEYQILHAEERLLSLETELFHTLREQVATHSREIRNIAQAIAHLDTLIALAQVATEHNFVCPIVDDSSLFQINQGRHPIIEATLQGDTFIPNDTLLDNHHNRLLLITGPNMAGKSTYIRQVALIAILAQMGSFVPASSAHLGIVDKVFSRIGASDDLSRGQSTFMVEMTETANILHNATSRSLVILDEIGRGTSTYDGISIAWAVAEYLLTEKDRTAKTLFATHYWELTALETLIPGAVNAHVAVHESDRGITFLHKIVKGSTDKSYGIHVARLAGLPSVVLKRAAAMLVKLEKQAGRTSQSAKEKQLSLFDAPTEAALPPKAFEPDPLYTELKALDPHQLTPLQALAKLCEWKEKIPR